jgi:hypothetical protein
MIFVRTLEYRSDHQTFIDFILIHSMSLTTSLHIYYLNLASLIFNYSRENKLEHIVTLKRGKVEEIDLDLKQVVLHYS